MKIKRLSILMGPAPASFWPLNPLRRRAEMGEPGARTIPLGQ
jgi:hypothetical protein